MSNPAPQVEYREVKLNQIQLDAVVPQEISEADKRFLAQSGGALPVHGGKSVRRVVVDGQPILPTGRFWTSLYSKFNLNTAFFKFFTHEEVFKRISERSNDALRITIEANQKGGDPRLLAATGLNKPVVLYDDLHGHLAVVRDGQGRHPVPRRRGRQFAHAADRPEPVPGGRDKFSNKFELHCPIDGYGQPSVFLSLLRWICTNGAVGFAKAFQTSLALGSGGDNVHYTIHRALDSFTNDEGYAMMRGRFDMATRSWASIREQSELYNVLLRLQNDPVLQTSIKEWNRARPEEAEMGVANALLKAFERTTGDPFTMYRAEPNLMSDKRKRTLPVQCKVYDMINFATELASHHVSEAGARQLRRGSGT
jgi:hypothetical protein